MWFVEMKAHKALGYDLTQWALKTQIHTDSSVCWWADEIVHGRAHAHANTGRQLKRPRAKETSRNESSTLEESRLTLGDTAADSNKDAGLWKCIERKTTALEF